MGSRTWAGLTLVVALTMGAGAAVLDVPEEYATVQKGIDAAVDGDTVRVAPGVYFERIRFRGKNITVTSVDPNDPGVVGYTILNGQQQGSVVVFAGWETSQAVLTGFTITGGTGTTTRGAGALVGGGINCSYAPCTITHNVITNNVMPYRLMENGLPRGSYQGGGIYGTGAVTIAYNVICRNTACSGGGIHCSKGAVHDNLIYDNSGFYGGGIYCALASARVTNNTIVGNDIAVSPEWGHGGNLYINIPASVSGLVANNIICSADSGGGIAWSGGVLTDTMFRHNDVWGNALYDYIAHDPATGAWTVESNAYWTGRQGNLSADPCFVAGWSRRYRLSEASPCISAGDPNFTPASGATDIDGDARVYGLRVDIGADEYIGYIQPIAEAGPTQYVPTSQLVTLDGSASYFSDPNAGVYRWTQVQGTAAPLDDPNIARPTFTPAAAGAYVFQLIVGDGRYTSHPDQVLIVAGN